MKTVSIVELLECRFELDTLMREFSQKVAADDSAGARLALNKAVQRALEVQRLASVDLKGRVHSQWHWRGIAEFLNGSGLTAALCMEFWSGVPGVEVDGDSRLKTELMKCRADGVRRLAAVTPPSLLREESQPPRREFVHARRKSGPARGPAPLEAASIREMCSQILLVARSRMFTMDREAVESDLDHFESLGGPTLESTRMRNAMHSLATWHPFGAETGSDVIMLAACSTIIRLQREADRHESRGDFLSAAAAHDNIAVALTRMPFRPLLDARGREARSSAARCRSLAGIPEPDPCTIKNW